MDTTTVYRDTRFLNPKFAGSMNALQENLTRLYETKRAQFHLKIYETFRSPFRQLHLRAEGATKAGAWQSAHQYGLACDFVPYLTASEATEIGRSRKVTVRPGWHWPEPTDEIWQVLQVQVKVVGACQPIAWDRPHVEDPRFDDLFQFLWK